MKCFRCNQWDGERCACKDGQTIFHGDCREILPLLPKVDAVLTDPPYGIGWIPRVNHRDDEQLWNDSIRPDIRPLLEIGKQHLFWGAQYFADVLPVSESWLAWIKRPVDFDFSSDGRTYATIELAWSDYFRKPSHKCIVWDGGKRQGKPENRSFCHPSQKPIELMQWCVSRLPDESLVVLDAYMGSGTTLRACKDLGRRGIGIELEEKYCEIAANRLRQEVLF